MELLKNYYSIHSIIHNDIKELIKSGNYESFILHLMNTSKIIFPNRYIHLDDQSNGECDFVDVVTGEKYDAKIPIDKRQGKLIGSRNGDVSAVSTEFHNEALEFQHCIAGTPVKPTRDLSLFKKIKENISRTNPDENVILFIPFPIVFDFEGFPLVGASDVLKKIYTVLAEDINMSARHLYAIYISFDKKMVLRDLKTDKREYIAFPQFQHYINYDIKCIEGE